MDSVEHDPVAESRHTPRAPSDPELKPFASEKRVSAKLAGEFLHGVAEVESDRSVIHRAGNLGHVTQKPAAPNYFHFALRFRAFNRA